MRNDEDKAFAAQLEATYIRIGCPPAQAKALVERGFAIHYQIEDTRAALLEGAGHDLMLLVAQLELCLMQGAVAALIETADPKALGTVGETVQ